MKRTVRLTENDLYKVVRKAVNRTLEEARKKQENLNGLEPKESKKVRITEVKNFHPTGKSEPNGSSFQRGGYYMECVKNFNSFSLDEDIHPKQYGLSDWRGGVIVFATTINAVNFSANAFVNKIKQAIQTFKNNVFKSGILKKVIDRFNSNKQAQGNSDYIGAYSVGHSFSGKYIGDNGEHFDDTSYTIEVNGLSSEGLMLFASYICRAFKQETVLVKDLNKNKIFLANSHNTGDNDYNIVNRKC